jgi:hypothetical protein
MTRLIFILAFAIAACEREPDKAEAPVSNSAADILQVEGGVSKPPPVIPLPTDQAEVDRMVLAGYTPHADHLHAPGVNECPMTKGNDAVM